MKNISALLAITGLMLPQMLNGMVQTAAVSREPSSVFRPGRNVEWSIPHLQDHDDESDHVIYHRGRERRHKEFHDRWSTSAALTRLHRQFHLRTNRDHRLFHMLQVETIEGTEHDQEMMEGASRESRAGWILEASLPTRSAQGNKKTRRTIVRDARERLARIAEARSSGTVSF